MAGNCSVKGMKRVGYRDDREPFSGARAAEAVAMGRPVAAASGRRLFAAHPRRIREPVGGARRARDANLGGVEGRRPGGRRDVDPVEPSAGGRSLHLQAIVLGPRDHSRGVAVGVCRDLFHRRAKNHNAGVQRQPCAAGPREAAGLQAGRHVGAEHAAGREASRPGDYRVEKRGFRWH
jgi:hypothetical protein